MAIPIGEFRALDISLTEPANRTTAGTVVNSANPLDMGTINNTSGYVPVGPKAVWWRVTDFGGNSEVSNMKIWMSQNSSLVGTNEYYCDITDTWTQNKTVSQVSSGSPGRIPESQPSNNITRINGGSITGTGHNDTSQYVYLAMLIGSDETVGIKGGFEGGFQLSIKFDYA